MKQIEELIQKYATENNVDPLLIKAIVKAESSFNIKATSPAGAMGLMQLMPATAKILKCENPYDPESNIQAGTKHFRNMLNLYSNIKDKREQICLALAAYNAGSLYINRALKHTRKKNLRVKWCIVSTFLRNEKFRWFETVEYVDKVMTFYNEFRNEQTQIHKKQLTKDKNMCNVHIVGSAKKKKISPQVIKNCLESKSFLGRNELEQLRNQALTCPNGSTSQNLRLEQVFNYSSVKTLKKGFNYFMYFIIPYICLNIFITLQNVENATFFDIIQNLINSTALGPITIGTLTTMIINWKKNTRKKPNQK